MTAIILAATMHSLLGERSQNAPAPMPTIRREVLGLTTEDLRSIVANLVQAHYRAVLTSAF
jgi:FlaG/FlaF family flagellin (archaellin)